MAIKGIEDSVSYASNYGDGISYAPNSDIIITAEANASSTPVSGGFNSYLLLKQSAA